MYRYFGPVYSDDNFIVLIGSDSKVDSVGLFGMEGPVPICELGATPLLGECVAWLPRGLDRDKVRQLFDSPNLVALCVDHETVLFPGGGWRAVKDRDTVLSGLMRALDLAQIGTVRR